MQLFLLCINLTKIFMNIDYLCQTALKASSEWFCFLDEFLTGAFIYFIIFKMRI